MNDYPYVSVIIPAFNAYDYLARSLPALKKSDYRNYELIIVDDHSSDDTPALAREYADIVIRMESRQAPGKSRNRGAQESKGFILFFIDADVEISRDTISKVVNFLGENPDVGAVFGSYDAKPLQNDCISQFKNLFHHYVHQEANTEARTFWAGCGAIRRDIFFGLGGFPEKYSSPSIEDVEMGYTMVKASVKIMLMKELQVKHLKRWTLWSLVKSDVIQRAIPWTRLTWKRGLPYDLNFKLADRISGLLVITFVLGAAMMWQWFYLGFLSVLSAILLFLLNRRLYTFFLRKKGVLFSLFSVFFHWLYLFYSSVTFILFTCVFSVKNRFSKQRQPSN